MSFFFTVYSTRESHGGQFFLSHSLVEKDYKDTIIANCRKWPCECKSYSLNSLLPVLSVSKVHISVLHYPLCDLLKHFLVLWITNSNTAAEWNKPLQCKVRPFPHSPLQDTTTKLERKCMIIGTHTFAFRHTRLSLQSSSWTWRDFPLHYTVSPGCPQKTCFVFAETFILDHFLLTGSSLLIKSHPSLTPALIPPSLLHYLNCGLNVK